MRELKVGDKVKILEESSYSRNILDYVGTVTKVGHTLIHFTVNNPTEAYDTHEWSTAKRCIKLIPSKKIVGGELL